MKNYDVFISHASEDKDLFVRPLAEKLSEMGLRVWYDEFSLKVGDSLTESIDQGIKESEFGLVVLSPDFFNKNWTKRELNGLTQIEMHSGDNMILPVWHNLSSEMVLQYSPPLADKKALDSSIGADLVAEKVFGQFTQFDWDNSNSYASEHTKEASTVIYCCIGLNEIIRIKHLFPDQKGSTELRNIELSLTELLTTTINSFSPLLKIYESVKATFESDPLKEEMGNGSIISFIVMKTRGGRPSSRDLFSQIVKKLAKYIPNELTELTQKIQNIQVFECLIPVGLNRSEKLSRAKKYWELTQAIINFEMKAELGWSPHPLTRLIVSLQRRFLLTFEDEVKNSQKAKEIADKIDSLCSVIIEDEPGAIGWVEEWTVQNLQTIQTSFEHLNPNIQEPDLTHAESMFFKTAESAINFWKQEVKVAFRSMIRNADTNIPNLGKQSEK